MSLLFSALDERPPDPGHWYPLYEGVWMHFSPVGSASARPDALILKEGAERPSGHAFALYELREGFLSNQEVWVRLTYRSTLEKAKEAYRAHLAVRPFRA